MVSVSTGTVSYTHLDVYKRQVEGEPLYVEEKSIMYLMARAAKQEIGRAHV